MRPKMTALALLAVLGLFATSCASSKDTGFPTPEPSASGAACEANPGSEVITGPVEVGDNFFAPLTAKVTRGTPIVWDVCGQAPHSITFDDGSFDEPAGCTAAASDKCTPSAGTEFTFTISKPGKYHYYCKIHGSARATDTALMIGYIIVT